MKDRTKRLAGRDGSNIVSDGGWLFPTKNGNPVDAYNFIHRPWKRMLRKQGYLKLPAITT
jgi:hypothetical protein